MFYSNHYESPLGTLTLCADEEGMRGLWIKGQKYHGDTIPEPMHSADAPEIFDPIHAWLDAYFAGEKPAISQLKLAPIGSDFRQLVWKELVKIPYGEVTTYGAIAEAVAAAMGRDHMASLAVGGAVGHNPISIIIPCHRVVGADGSLTGYAGGLDKKIWLLTHEGFDMSKVYRPTKGTAL